MGTVYTFTDFGHSGPYLGQMEAAVCGVDASLRVIHLQADAPRFEPHLSGVLLAAVVRDLPREGVVLAVVDPGVGTEQRQPVVVEADGRFFVGPGNGLFDAVAAQAESVRVREILWRPARLSSSFHGRDLFAPVAARLAFGAVEDGMLGLARPYPAKGDVADLERIVFIDHYGNGMTGIRASRLAEGAGLRVDGYVLPKARTFGEMAVGEAFWYENSLGLAEIAVNQGSAAERFSLFPGKPVERVELAE